MAATSYKDRIAETSTFTGGGTVALLGAINGFASFTRYNASQSGIPVLMEAIDAANQPTGEWEVALCTLSADKRTLTRNTVRDSSNAGALVSFGAGTKRVTVVNDGMSIEYPLGAYVSEKAFDAQFTGYVADQKIRFDWPANTRLQGRVEITCATGYDGANAVGYIKKTYGLYLHETNGSAYTQDVNSEGSYPCTLNLRLSNFLWDGTKLCWYVVVASASANRVSVTIKTYAATHDNPAWTNMAASKVVMSALYIDPTVYPAISPGASIIGSFSATLGINGNGATAISTTNRNPGVYVYKGNADYGMELGYSGGVYAGRIFVAQGQGQVITLGSITDGGTQQANFTDWARFSSAGLTVTGTITSTATPLATVSQLANYLPLTGGKLTGRLLASAPYGTDVTLPYAQLQIGEPGLTDGGAWALRLGYWLDTGAWRASINAVNAGAGTTLNINPSGGNVIIGGDGTGKGIEFSVNAGNGVIQTYDRTAPGYIPTKYYASQHEFHAGTTSIATVSATGLAVTGTVTASDKITGAGIQSSNGGFYRSDGTNIIAAVPGGTVYFYSTANSQMQFVEQGGFARVIWDLTNAGYQFLQAPGGSPLLSFSPSGFNYYGANSYFGNSSAPAADANIYMRNTNYYNRIWMNSYAPNGTGEITDGLLTSMRGSGLFVQGTPNIYFTAGATQVANFTGTGLTLTPTSGTVVKIGTGTATASTTPARINMGGSHSSVAGANPKLALFDNDGGVVFGLGISDSQLDHMVPAGMRHCFYVGGTKVAQIDGSGVTSPVAPLATVSQLANYLPLSGGTVTGQIFMSSGASPNIIHKRADGTGSTYPAYVVQEWRAADNTVYGSIGCMSGGSSKMYLHGKDGINLMTTTDTPIALLHNTVEVASTLSTGLQMGSGKAISGNGGGVGATLAITGAITSTASIPSAFASSVDGYGFRLAAGTVSYFDNGNGTLFGSDIYYRTGRIHIFQTGTNPGTTPAEILRIDNTGLAVAAGKTITIGGVAVGTIAADSVTNAMLADMAANTVKVNQTAGAANPTDLLLSASQLLGRGASSNISACSLAASLAFTGATLGVVSVPNALTFATTGGVGAGNTFNGSVARTIDYSSIGAAPDAPRVGTSTTAATLVPVGTNDMTTRTTQTVNLTVNAPTGTPVNGFGHVIRIKATAAIASVIWDAIYRAIGVTLPTSLVSGKTTYIGCIYNSTDSKWDVTGVMTEA